MKLLEQIQLAIDVNNFCNLGHHDKLSSWIAFHSSINVMVILGNIVNTCGNFVILANIMLDQNNIIVLNQVCIIKNNKTNHSITLDHACFEKGPSKVIQILPLDEIIHNN
jgi:hypothetical protein